MDSPQIKPFTTPRAIFMALILIIINSYWQAGITGILDIEITDLSLFSNVVFISFVLILLNYVLRKYMPRRALQQREILTIYVMLATSTALNGTDMIKALISLMGNGSWYATPENDWENLFGRYLPNWLTISDGKILRGYYEGDSTLYISEYIMRWLPRALAWSSFTVVIIFVMLCINIILRRQWVTNERLSYPIAQLPFEMTRTDRTLGLFRNKLMWIGFSVAAFISIVNQANVLWPVIPSIPVQPVSLTKYFSTKPWNSMRYMFRTFYPFAIGMGYLMPLGLITSTWLFHLFWQAQRVAGSVAGFASLPGFPYEEAQVQGAWVALLILTLWIGRRYFLNVIADVFRGSGDDTGDSFITYRVAFLGIIAGLIFLVTFCYYAGMSVWLASIFFVFYFAFATTVTRIRAQLGPPTHEIRYAATDKMIVMLMGTRRIGSQNLTAFCMLHWLGDCSSRENPMPIQLEGFKLIEYTNTTSKGFMLAILLAAGVGSVSGFWSYLHRAYELGVESYPERTWVASIGFRTLESRIQNLTGPQSIEIIFAGAGFIFTAFMLIMHLRFLWWPLHPIGYVISGTWPIGRLFFPLVIASITKWLILRFSGLRTYRQSMPFFLGLIMGDFVLGSIWTMISLVFRIPMYRFWTG
jgi:hypothetical protein